MGQVLISVACPIPTDPDVLGVFVSGVQLFVFNAASGFGPTNKAWVDGSQTKVRVTLVGSSFQSLRTVLGGIGTANLSAQYSGSSLSHSASNPTPLTGFLVNGQPAQMAQSSAVQLRAVDSQAPPPDVLERIADAVSSMQRTQEAMLEQLTRLVGARRARGPLRLLGR